MNAELSAMGLVACDGCGLIHTRNVTTCAFCDANKKPETTTETDTNYRRLEHPPAENES